MRLGTIIGGKNWSDMNRALKDQEVQKRKLQREAEKKRARRDQLDAMGFKPIGGNK